MMDFSLKGTLPFRLGTSSYIIPDDILPNVRYLSDFVDDIQIILFESDAISNLPSPRVIDELAAIAADKDLTYTVHFPLDVYLGTRDEAIRQASIEKCCRIMERCRPLAPQTFALHFAGDDPGDRGSVPSADLPGWCDALDRSLGALVAEAECSRHLCVETLSYPFALIEDVVVAHDAGVCLDIGHLLCWGHDVEAHLARHAERMHLMHIHGVLDGKDHSALQHLSPALLEAAIKQMTSQDGQYRVMTVEVFGQQDFEESMRCLRARA